jgi:hypothetical protein
MRIVLVALIVLVPLAYLLTKDLFITDVGLPLNEIRKKVGVPIIEDGWVNRRSKEWIPHPDSAFDFHYWKWVNYFEEDTVYEQDHFVSSLDTLQRSKVRLLNTYLIQGVTSGVCKCAYVQKVDGVKQRMVNLSCEECDSIMETWRK